MKFSLPRPTPALVIACIALFVSMGGVSWAFATGSIDGREIRNGTITTKDVRNNEVRGADIRNSTIGGRDVAFNTLGGNDIKESTLGKVPTAIQSDSAISANSANQLAGVPAGDYMRREAPTFLPLPGADPGTPAPGYDLDPTGYVNLRGTILNGTFTLPEGARPAATSRFIVPDSTDGSPELLEISPAGVGTVEGAVDDVNLDGVDFAAGG